jgi:hypothetical protein
MGKSLIPTDSKTNDRVYTPDDLAERIVGHFNPFGKKCLDPCKGTGAFVRAFEKYGINPDWCEIDEGRDFFDYHEKVDWIISNFPWSLHRDFMKHSMEISDNIVTLVTVNHVLALKARMRDIRQMGFYVRELLYVDTPKEFPQSGFALSAILVNKNEGDIKVIDWTTK